MHENEPRCGLAPAPAQENSMPRQTKDVVMKRKTLVYSIIAAIVTLACALLLKHRVAFLGSTSFEMIDDCHLLTNYWREVNLYRSAGCITASKANNIQNAIKEQEAYLYEQEGTYAVALECINSVVTSTQYAHHSCYATKYRLLMLLEQYNNAAIFAAHYRQQITNGVLGGIPPDKSLPLTYALESHAYRCTRSYDKAANAIQEGYIAFSNALTTARSYDIQYLKSNVGLCLLLGDTYALIGDRGSFEKKGLVTLVEQYDLYGIGDKYYYMARSYCENRAGNTAKAQYYSNVGDVNGSSIVIRRYGLVVPR